MKNIDLTTGSITKKLWLFSLPLMLGNVLQQFYNLADTWVVGRFIGSNALAAVGSSYTLMTFLNSVIIGLCLGAGTFFSVALGQKDLKKIKNGKFISLVIIGTLSLLTGAVVYFCRCGIIGLMQIPPELFEITGEYLAYVSFGVFALFIYNYYACFLRGIGNSGTPLVFLGVSVVLNIGLDFYFVAALGSGIKGAAVATVISQYIAGVGIAVYSFVKYPRYRVGKADVSFNSATLKSIASLSGFTCLQQSVMNFGILAVQGIVNGFGTAVMSAFAVAVKIDTVAYMPVQDFGNGFSTFVAQNYGAKKPQRIKTGIKQSVISVALFCVVISTVVCVFAPWFMKIFISPSESEIIEIGVKYLRIEGAFYLGIGILFMLYGYFRAVDKPAVSVVLTVISLGTRVFLAAVLSKIGSVGVIGIWVSIPIGWFLADVAGVVLMKKIKRF